jgi:hypothetical protein
MYNYDYSIMGLTENIASRKDFNYTNSDGTKDLSLNAGGWHLKYNSLWNFIPDKKVEPGHTGVT